MTADAVGDPAVALRAATAPPDDHGSRWWTKFPGLAGTALIVVGAVSAVLRAGGLIDSEKHWFPSIAIAAALALLGVALRQPASNRTPSVLRPATAGALLFLCLLLTGIALRAPERPLHATLALLGAEAPIISTLGLTCLAAALLLQSAADRARHARVFMALCGAGIAIGTHALMSRVFGAPDLAQFLTATRTVSVVTACALIAGGTAVLMSDEVMSPELLLGSGLVEQNAWRLFLSLAVVIFGVMLVAQFGFLQKWYDAPSRGALGATLITVATFITLFSTLERLRLLKVESDASRAQLLMLSEARGALVQQRTAEVESLSRTLQMSRQGLSLAIQGSSDGFFEWNAETDVVTYSDRLIAFLGFTPEEWSQTRTAYRDRIHPDDVADADAVLRLHLRTARAEPYSSEYRLRCQDGSYRWVLSTGQAEWNSAGRAVRLAGSIKDVTEAREAQHALDDERKRLRVVLDAAQLGFWIWNIDDGTEVWDRNFLALHGYAEGELVPSLEAWKRTVHPDDAAMVHAALSAHLADERIPYDVEYRALTKQGTVVWINATGSVVAHGASGAPARMMGVVRDATSRHAAAALLQTRNAELKALLHVTSHDLREPLRGILGFARLLEERLVDRLDDTETDYLARLSRAARRLDGLLDDTSMLAKARQAEIPPTAIDAAPLVREALLRLEDRIRDTGATVRVIEPLPQLQVNPTWGTQAIYNLVLNALKFTRPGVAPDVEIRGELYEGHAGLVVADRGTGVPQEHAERIFELFQRAVGRSVEGSGAGLAIVKQVASRHGGTAFVRPRAGGGSEFVITFEGGAERPLSATSAAA